MYKLQVNYLIIFSLIAISLQQPITEIEQGYLTGFYMQTIGKRTVAAYLGIPYAKPPIGHLRFKEPIAATPWLGVYNATSFPDECLQYSHLTYKTDRPIYGSEDCLYINVFTPKLSLTDNIHDLDVLVFIHGGALMFFTSSYYSPAYLLERNVLMVTFNFRLGALGFLSLEDHILPGNNGLKDQSLALRWVKNNIAAFGGNPNKITISGFSSGGASVQFHMLSPLSNGLFNKAIIAGGSALCPWTLAEKAREKTIRLASYLGCPIHNSLIILECLQERSASRIVGATKLFQPWMYNPFSPFGIVIEPPGPCSFISEQPIDIILKKKSKDVPFMITMCAAEGTYPGAEIFANPEEMEAIDSKWNEYLPFLLDYNYTIPADRKDHIAKEIRDFYLGNAHVEEAKDQFIKMIGDRMFYVGTIKSAKLQAELYNSPVYSYLFSYKGSRRFSDLFNLPRQVYDVAGHGDDIPYVLRASYMPLDDNVNDMLVSRRMVDYWVRFIKGTPMPEYWTTVNHNLPKFGFLEIKQVDNKSDVLKIVDDYGNEKFWDSLNFNENIPKSLTEDLPSHNYYPHDLYYLYF